MRIRGLIAMVVLGGGSLVACAVPEEPEEEERVSTAIRELMGDKSAKLVNAGPDCAAIRFVTYNVTCNAAVKKWSGAPLFQADEFETPSGLYVPQELQKYCVYSWIGPSTEAPSVDTLREALSSFPSADKLIAPDCEVVSSPERTPRTPDKLFYSPAVLEPLEETARKRWGIESVALPSPEWPVRLSVIDSSVYERMSGQVGIGADLHGRAVADVARKIACTGLDEDMCTATVPVTNHLALAHRSMQTTNFAEGGTFGSLGQLATAIWHAVASTPSGTRLVLNMSVGWEHQGPSFSAAERAVEAALQFASCRDAISIAAAGNRQSSLSSSGPLYPAAFELTEGPADCQPFGGVAPSLGAYPSLVLAVSGVDTGDRPLSNARDGSRSPLSAYGLGIVGGGTSESPPFALSGSSMAAAAVSGMAARLFSRKSAGRGQVLDALYGGGSSLPATSDFSFRGSRPKRMRASLCGAFALLQYPVPLDCPPSGDAATPGEAWLSDLEVQTPSFATLSSADERDQGARPWTGPQPPSQGCPACHIQLGAMGQDVIFEGSLSHHLITASGALRSDVQMMLAVETTLRNSTIKVEPPPGESRLRIKIPLEVGESIRSATIVWREPGQEGTVTTYEAITTQPAFL